MTYTRSILPTFLVGLMLGFGASGEPFNYTRTATLPSIRTTYREMQAVINKATDQMVAVNAPTATRPFKEKITVRHGQSQVEIEGRQIQGTDAQLPDIATEFVYSATAFSLDRVPITSMSLDFDDYRRRLTVTGQSSEQVNALFGLIEAELLKLTSMFGGAVFRTAALTCFIILCLSAIWWPFIDYVSKRRRLRILPMLLGVAGCAIPFFAPLHDMLAGCSIYATNPPFLIHYGPQISMLVLLITLLNIPFLFRREASAPVKPRGAVSAKPRAATPKDKAANPEKRRAPRAKKNTQPDLFE